MRRKNKKLHTASVKGQNMVEYMILAVGVVVVLLVFLRPNGYFATTLDSALDESFNHINYIAQAANRYQP